MKFQFDFPRAFLFSRLSVALVFGTLLAGFVTETMLADETARTTGNKGDFQSVPELKPEHGPWLVFAMSFDGPDAKIQAERLATELRRDYKLQAYCMTKQIDFTQPLVGAGIDKNGNNRRMKFRDKKVVEGYAVFVGDFDSIDNHAIEDALATVKRITPRTLSSNEAVQNDLAKSNLVPNNSWRNFMKGKTPDKPLPMSTAFKTRNPLLPDDFYKTPEVDRFVKKLNEQREYAEFSLLSCPGKFTVRVAVFTGEEKAVGGWGGASSLESSNENKISQLDLAAERATLTTRALRRAGYEAYQFHDRTQSIVTVGSFNELGKTDPSNRFTYDPAIQAIAARFGATSQLTRSTYGVTQTPRLLFDLVDQRKIPEINEGDEKSKLKWFTKHAVAFDLKPSPMAVPRPSASSIYSGSLLGNDRR